MLVMDLVEKGLVTDQVTLTVGYDIENLTDPVRRSRYTGEVVTDFYGRLIPKHAHGTANFPGKTASTEEIIGGVMALYDRIVDKALLVRRIQLSACRLARETDVGKGYVQLDLFSDSKAEEKRERERRRQRAVLTIRRKFGKNAIFKGMNLEEGATAMERNQQIGGHKA